MGDCRKNNTAGCNSRIICSSDRGMAVISDTENDRYLFSKVEAGWSEGTAIFPSRIIAKLDNSRYSHCYWKFTLKNGMIFIYESHFNGGVQITPYAHLLQAQISGRVGAIEECLVVCNPDALWNECIKYHGSEYNVEQIIRYYIWIKYFKRRGQVFKPFVNGKFTCNELMIATGKAAVPVMKELDYSSTPEALYRFFMGHPSKTKRGNKHDYSDHSAYTKCLQY